MKDSTHFITQSALRFFSGTMLSRITGLMRDIAMASAFGTNAAVAIFLVAFRFSHLFRRLLGEGAMQTTFIPHFEKLRKEDPERACRFFRDLNFMLIAVLIILVLGSITFLSGLLLGGGVTPANRECLFLTILMLPSLLFICLFGINAGLLQCEKSYFVPSLAPCVFNIIWILGVFSLWKFSPEEAMPWLAGFVTLACLGQWLITVPMTRRILKKQGLTSIENGYQWFSSDLKNFIKPLFLGIVGVSASQVNNALDGIFAWYADPEGPAFLWYAIRLQQLPIGLFGIALSGAVLPPLSRALSHHNLSQYKQFLEFALKRSLSLMLPITTGIFLLGKASIQLLYGRGDFGPLSVLGTTKCLWGYGFGLIPTCLVLILSPAFYAKGDYRTPTLTSLASMALNVGLNFLLIGRLSLGAASVAWATSFSAWFNVVVLGILLWKAVGPYLSFHFWIDMGKILLSTLTGTLALLLAEHAWQKETSVLFIEQAIHLAYLSMAFGISFLGILAGLTKRAKRIS